MSDALRHEVWVSCPVDHAFRTFTARLDEWWPAGHRRAEGSRVTLESRVGGRFVDRGPDGTEVALGEVVRWEPPRLVAYTWRPGAPPGSTSLVEVSFAEEGGRTRVVVVHSAGGIAEPEWPTRVARFADGWGNVLPAFVARAGR